MGNFAVCLFSASFISQPGLGIQIQGKHFKRSQRNLMKINETCFILLYSRRVLKTFLSDASLAKT